MDLTLIPAEEYSGRVRTGAYGPYIVEASQVGQRDTLQRQQAAERGVCSPPDPHVKARFTVTAQGCYSRNVGHEGQAATSLILHAVRLSVKAWPNYTSASWFSLSAVVSDINCISESFEHQ